MWLWYPRLDTPRGLSKGHDGLRGCPRTHASRGDSRPRGGRGSSPRCPLPLPLLALGPACPGDPCLGVACWNTHADTRCFRPAWGAVEVVFALFQLLLVSADTGRCSTGTK